MADIKEKAKDILNATGQGAIAVAGKGKDLALNAKNQVINTLDVNNDGQVDIEDIIILALKTPGIKINREKFLRKEFKIHYDKKTVDTAIHTTPNLAGIPQQDIDTIADAVIEYERRYVSGISAVLGVPGGTTMAATIPTDIVQYYGYLIRATQKLMYLYGFPQIIDENNELIMDTPTINSITLAMGVMFGVQGANTGLKAMATALGVGVEKKLLNTALTKGTFYPIVKSTAKWFGTRMTKEIFAGFFKDAIPVVGGILGGGITYLSFKPCCNHLKEILKDTKLSVDNYKESKEEKTILEGLYKEIKEEK